MIHQTQIDPKKLLDLILSHSHGNVNSEFYTHEGALLALMKAPVPPSLLKPVVWEAIRKQQQDEAAKGT